MTLTTKARNRPSKAKPFFNRVSGVYANIDNEQSESEHCSARKPENEDLV